MEFGSSDSDRLAKNPVVFATTRWSVVMAAGDSAAPGSFEALTQLCQSYWFPLYAYVRRRGRSPEDAQDLTQEFFARFLEKEYFARADQSRGRFRTFLLASMKNFLADEHDRQSSQKRGGGRETITIDEAAAETRYLSEPRDETTPDALFDKRWATTLLQQVVDALRQEFTRTGKVELFEAFKTYLWGDTSTPIREIAGHVQMTENAVKVSIHRLRKRYRELLRQAIADTVDSPEQIDDELRYLARMLRE